MSTRCCWVLGWLLLLGSLGCEQGPRAPALRDSPVFQNNQEGLRFLVPDNWMQAANASLPPGNLEGEVVLVQYKMKTAGQGASFEVLCFDDDFTDDLSYYHQLPSHAVEMWNPVEEPETTQINGVEGQHFLLAAEVEGQEMTKEVVSFRHGQRVYSFIGLFWTSDEKAREQLQRTIDSIMWR